jgi:hypothetical protein
LRNTPFFLLIRTYKQPVTRVVVKKQDLKLKLQDTEKGPVHVCSSAVIVTALGEGRGEVFLRPTVASTLPRI